MKNSFLISVFILLGLLFGTVVGHLLYDPSWSMDSDPSAHKHAVWLSIFSFIGFTVFMGLLKMLIIPLIGTSVIVAVTSVGDFRKLGRLGIWTLLYYFATMFIAVTIGLILVNIINPGANIGESQRISVNQSAPAEMAAEAAAGGLMGVFKHMVELMIPENIIAALASGQTLPTIIFCIFFGVVITLVGDSARILVDVSRGAFDVLMRMVEIVLYLAPVGVFCLLAWSIARIGLGVFGESIGSYMITVLFGLTIHGLVVLPIILVVGARLAGKKVNPLLYLHQMKEALLTAIGTDSSSATLPVTIDCATNRGGVSQETAGLVLPLGATINMDGTALYEAVAVVFMAQAFGIELGMSQMIIIAVTATLAAIGAAGIPSAGLVTMVIVLDVTNQSLEALGAGATLIPVGAIGLIIGVDRLLDMARTAINVWGDAVGAKLIDAIVGED